MLVENLAKDHVAEVRQAAVEVVSCFVLLCCHYWMTCSDLHCCNFLRHEFGIAVCLIFP